MKALVARRIIMLLAAAGLVIAAPARGHAQFVLYDNFSSGAIDPEKWANSSLEGNFSQPTAEFVRIVENGSLRLSLVSWGGTANNSGSIGSRQGLRIRQLGTLGGPGFITALSAKITALNAEAEDCTGNPETAFPARARALIFGFFFNDGSGSPTSLIGNIAAFLQLQQDKDGSRSIAAFLLRCDVDSCSTAPVIAMTGNPVVFTTTWSLNTPLNLKIIWDDANGKFKFKVTNPATAATETKSIVYQGVTNAGPPTFFDTKQVRVQNTAENCTASRKRAFMDALFDNVKVQRLP